MPGLGDGPFRSDESKNMLITLNEHGLQGAVAVTHLDYRRIDDPLFFKERYLSSKLALERVSREIKSKVRLFYSFEVDYEDHMFHEVDMHPYVIPGTDLVSVNIPLGDFTNEMVKDFSYLIHKQHLRPLFCNFERHILFPKLVLPRILSMSSASYLISASSLLLPETEKVLLPAMEAHKTFYFCTNAHDSENRPPLLTPEKMRIFSKGQFDILKKLESTNKNLYRRIIRSLSAPLTSNT